MKEGREEQEISAIQPELTTENNTLVTMNLWMFRVTVVGLGVLLFFLFLLIQQYAPLIYPLQGDWQPETEGTYRLMIRNNTASLLIKDSEEKGYYSQIKWTIQPKGINLFKSSDAQASMVLKKSFFTVNQLEDFRKAKDFYELESETNKEMVLVYKNKLVKKTFGVENLNLLMSIKVMPTNLFNKSIQLKNSSFLPNGLILIKE